MKPPHGTPGRGRDHTDPITIRPISQMRSAYLPLHSPAPSSSDSSTLPQRRPSGLGLGIDPGIYSLRPPDRAYLADKERIGDSIRSVNGKAPDSGLGIGSRGSSRSRRLQKKRIVEGGWELVRRDVDSDGVSQGWTNVEMEDQDLRSAGDREREEL